MSVDVELVTRKLVLIARDLDAVDQSSTSTRRRGIRDSATDVFLSLAVRDSLTDALDGRAFDHEQSGN